MMRIPFIVLLLIGTSCFGIDDFNTKFTGSINKQYPIEINLIHQNHQLYGSYKYLSEKTYLKLNGTITDDGHFHLNEFNAKGSLTGQFDGKMIESHLVGTWRKPDNSRSYTFLATEIENGNVNAALENDSVKIYQAIYDWSEAHNTQNISIFETLFANDILFYCKKIKRPEALHKKKNMFRKCTFFRQIITTPIIIQEYSSGLLKCSFTKRVTKDSTTKDYRSYLLLNYDGDHPLISGESDLTTDENSKYTLEIGEPVNKRSLIKILLYTFLMVAIVILLLFNLRKIPKLYKPASSSATSIADLLKMKKK